MLKLKTIAVSFVCAAVAGTCITGECHLIKRCVRLSKERDKIFAEYKESKEFKNAYAAALEKNEVEYATSTEPDFKKRYQQYVNGKGYINSDRFIIDSIAGSSYGQEYSSVDLDYFTSAMITGFSSLALMPAAFVAASCALGSLAPEKSKEDNDASTQPEITM